jgi:hypothetical protein
VVAPEGIPAQAGAAGGVGAVVRGGATAGVACAVWPWSECVAVESVTDEVAGACDATVLDCVGDPVAGGVAPDAAPDVGVVAPVSACVRARECTSAVAAVVIACPDPESIETDEPAGSAVTPSTAPAAPTGSVAMTATATTVAKNTERFDTFVPPYNVAPSPTELALTQTLCPLTG